MSNPLSPPSEDHVNSCYFFDTCSSCDSTETDRHQVNSFSDIHKTGCKVVSIVHPVVIEDHRHHHEQQRLLMFDNNDLEVPTVLLQQLF